jgi:ABC-type Mn2+/Zn2+ transport system permease subunit
MIQLYRIVGFFLLVASSASLVSLLASLVNQLREPFFVLALLCAIGLGVAGTVTYYRKTDDDKEWVIGLVFIVGLAVALLLGGIIQWVTQ